MIGEKPVYINLHKEELLITPSKVATKLRVQIEKFSGELSRGLSKPSRHFVADMLCGIQASQSVMLTEIGRHLEERISLKKTHERLSRNLMQEGLGERVRANQVRLGAQKIGSASLLIVDIGDITKEHAKSMEHIADVRDGDTGEIKKGYWLVNVVETRCDSPSITPLYQHLYSQEAPGFESENTEIIKAVDAVAMHAGTKGLWVVDRGGDRIKLYCPLLDRKHEFLIRLRGDRHLLFNKKKLAANEIASDCRCRHAMTLTGQKEGRGKTYRIQFGFRRVKLPRREEQLYMLVVKGFGDQPLMLLTNRPLKAGYKILSRMVKAYLKRWSVEDTFRFVKQSYDLENVRVLTYKSLQNLLVLVSAVMYFTAVVIDTAHKLTVMVGYLLKAAKRVFGIPDFKYYALADGIGNILSKHPARPKPFRDDDDPQLWLPLFNSECLPQF